MTPVYFVDKDSSLSDPTRHWRPLRLASPFGPSPGGSVPAISHGVCIFLPPILGSSQTHLLSEPVPRRQAPSVPLRTWEVRKRVLASLSSWHLPTMLVLSSFLCPCWGSEGVGLVSLMLQETSYKSVRCKSPVLANTLYQVPRATLTSTTN